MKASRSTRGEAAASVREAHLSLPSPAGPVPLLTHEAWSRRFPWLVQGTTQRGAADAAFDLGLAGAQPVGTALARWRALATALAFDACVVARQVHGSALLHHDRAGTGIHLAGPADGHLTRAAGLLLAVTVADCVPVSLVDPRSRTVALLHAGWRGVAAGVLEAGITAVQEVSGSGAETLLVHLGPSICGLCYEVGPEVHAALGHVPPPAAVPVDLRAELATRASAMGVPAGRISRSAWCTRCHRDRLFSHRAGDAGRQVGVLGIRARGDAGRD